MDCDVVIVSSISHLKHLTTTCLQVMGTKLVDPFGHDKVDIPMEAFCETIEGVFVFMKLFC